MVEFKSLDDIEREKHEEERERLKKNVSKDINEVITNVLEKRRKEADKKRKTRKWWVKLLLALLSLGLFLMVLNFVLGNIWLLKFFIKDFFHIGG
jgi:F0F1-type ATP synthase assembly protein I